MSLLELSARSIRNIENLKIQPASGLNILFGKNGSGKTSVLEAIHYLGVARSFRSRINSKVISNGQQHLMVAGITTVGIPLGVEKHLDGKTRIKVNSENQYSAAALAENLPLQLINPDSYQIIEAGPTVRRQFLDWGVFHVEHGFFADWTRARKILKQRNAALRARAPESSVRLWDAELVTLAKRLDERRENYLRKLQPFINAKLAALLDFPIEVTYKRGWQQGDDLGEVLRQAFLRDQQLGYTQYGPHRADLILATDSLSAKDTLSRGQKKLLVCALKLAQGELLTAEAQKTCVYLIDDMAAELDVGKRQALIGLLKDLQTQVFITSVELDVFADFDQSEQTKLFHVEQGVVNVSVPDKV